ncbi:MAG: glycosyltransferase family 4 protein [Cyanobacteria bacterium P01_C01_bin.118]
MKITVVALESPFPAIHGGRVDIWRRLQVLSELGVSIQLVYWAKTQLNLEDEQKLANVVNTSHMLKLNGTSFSSLLRKISFFPRYPLEISSRMVYGQALKDLKATARKFAPDVVMIDHLHGCMAGRQLSQYLQVPLILRSHNIEHLYCKNLYASAQGHRKLVRLLSLNGLEKVEKDTLKECRAFYDISVDDLEYWRSLGFKNGRFLPPTINLAEMRLAQNASGSEQPQQEEFDVVFLGNLNTENNVAGLVWFLTNVAPKLKAREANISILISGSNPVKKIVDLCDSLDYVTLKANPKSAADIYRSGRVLINPMAVGGGVSIKAIDMLSAARPIVTLPKGVGGLPERSKSLFYIAEDSDSFAEKILFCLHKRSDNFADYNLLDELFGVEQIKTFLKDLEENVLAAQAV